MMTLLNNCLMKIPEKCMVLPIQPFSDKSQNLQTCIVEVLAVGAYGLNGHWFLHA